MEQTNIHGISTKHNNNNNHPNPNPNPDLISALPDSLLLHILSLLDMDEVMKTSLLSRRWRYLWKSIPCLCFHRWYFYFPNFTNFIDKCLFHHEDSKIQKLHIIYSCVEDEDEVIEHALPDDSWIHFAMKCKVEDFVLDLFSGDYENNKIPYDKLYKLPYSLYLCTTLTSLTLRGCNLNLPDSFRLDSLKKLSLSLLELYSDSIEHFSSNCPVLEDIYLKDCNRDRDLINIVIKNENVKRLEISEFRLRGYYCVIINAPTLLSLGIYECDPDVRFHVEELGSLMSVDLVAEDWLLCCYSEVYTDKFCMEELLYDLRHVKKHLKLCSLCIQVLSLMKLQSVDLLSISATCLEQKAGLEKWELPGISYLLQSCSNLEKLKIVNQNYLEIEVSQKFIDKHDFVEEEYWASFETDVPTIMQNIKSIEIDLGSESRHEEFVRFLLKNAKVLESMIINTPKRYANNFELLFKFTQRLIAFPRSSPNATVIIR